MKTTHCAHRVAFCGIMAAFAIVLGYVEHLIPLPIGIYGIKLGLANLAILSLLYLTDIKQALTVHVLRIAVCGFLFGNVFSLIYSLAGGLFSFLVMALLKRWGRFSPIGVSVCGGVAHNLAQLIAAVCLVDQLKLAFYLPVLLLAGTLAGFAVGSCSLIVIRALKKKNAG